MSGPILRDLSNNRWSGGTSRVNQSPRLLREKRKCSMFSAPPLSPVLWLSLLTVLNLLIDVALLNSAIHEVELESNFDTEIQRGQVCLDTWKWRGHRVHGRVWNFGLTWHSLTKQLLQWMLVSCLLNNVFPLSFVWCHYLSFNEYFMHLSIACLEL
jgi:hypothetical protein